MHDKVNGTSSADPQCPVHKFRAINGDHPLTGVPLCPVLIVVGASQMQQQGVQLDISYFPGFFLDVFKWIFADQALPSSFCNFSC